MKKMVFMLLPAMVLASAISCSKSGTTASAYTSLEGVWTGTYSNGHGGPINYYSMNFKPGGALVIHANNVSTPDIANGSWVLTGDSVKGSYSFVGSSGISSFAAKYSASSNIMNGSTGVGSSTTGESVFSVARQ